MATRTTKKKTAEVKTTDSKAYLSVKMADNGDVLVQGTGNARDTVKLLEYLIVSVAKEMGANPDELLAYISDEIIDKQAGRIADLVGEFLDKLRRV